VGEGQLFLGAGMQILVEAMLSRDPLRSSRSWVSVHQKTEHLAEEQYTYMDRSHHHLAPKALAFSLVVVEEVQLSAYLLIVLSLVGVEMATVVVQL